MIFGAFNIFIFESDSEPVVYVGNPMYSAAMIGILEGKNITPLLQIGEDSFVEYPNTNFFPELKIKTKRTKKKTSKRGKKK